MSAPLSPAEEALREAARDYHRNPVRGKISITPTKPLVNQRDLSLAYSPGVAYPCLDIEADPAMAAEYTSPTRLPREVYSAAMAGSASMSRQG